MEGNSPKSRSRGPVRWTNTSVKKLAPNGDPINAVTLIARRTVMFARDKGWGGPPFDPFTLAQVLGYEVAPKEGIAEARTVPLPNNKLRIEYNPRKSIARIRFSVAHELAHTLFPDCRERIRHRTSKSDALGDEWQLEMLCNLGAAEFLMPTGHFDPPTASELTIDRILEMRSSYAVSTEAVLLRLVRTSRDPLAIYAASRIEEGKYRKRYQVDYFIPSRSWPDQLRPPRLLPEDSCVRECTAIGFTAKGTATWASDVGPCRTECVGIPPYPGRTYPRIVGICRLSGTHARTATRIEYLKGDALAPRGTDKRIIAHIVNDRTPRWGGGFALEVKKKYPEVQEDFIQWVENGREHLRLGQCRLSKIDHNLTVFSMIAQHGYGSSSKPRLRYAAFEQCLEQLSGHARTLKATIHSPRIGAGQAGGDWQTVAGLLDEHLSLNGIDVSIYDLPGQAAAGTTQPALFPNAQSGRR